MIATADVDGRGRVVPTRIDLIRAHRRNTGCAGSVIDLDGRCHTCGMEIG